MENSQLLVKLVNQLFDLEKKIAVKAGDTNFSRNFKRISETFDELGLIVHNPIGEAFSDTRTDCEATITGATAKNLKVVEVLKPIVYAKVTNSEKHMLQRGVVIVAD